MRTVPTRRVLVVSASMGAGHDTAANELVRRLRAQGHVCECVDVLELGRPGQGRRLRSTYRLLLRYLPWVYDGAMRLWARWPAPLELVTAQGARSYERGLLRQVTSFEPDVVVSFYNLASQALGRLRKSEHLPVPVATFVTDPGAHPYWVHPAVDLHLAVLPGTAQALRGLGAPRVLCCDPLVRPEFQEPLGQHDARRWWGLPATGCIVLVSAGSWAAGDVGRTVDLLGSAAGVVTVVLCGHDKALLDALTERGGSVPLGWTDEVASVMAAADVLVDNAGGLTCLEARARGLPVVLFRPLPGHGRINAAQLAASGVAQFAGNDRELLPLVLSLCAPSTHRLPAPPPPAADAAVEVLNLAVNR